MLEAQCHERSCFVTFTYEKEPSNGSVCKDHLSSTFHRLRAAARRQDRHLRFFGVGEYGDRTFRPHYHAAVFGLGVPDAQLIDDAWHGLSDADGSVPGFTHCGVLTPDSASYVGGYVTKKLTSKDDPRLGGRSPEFAVMSRRPGIGSLGLGSLIEAFNTSAGALYFARHGDVPSSIQIGGKSLPLGGHLRRQLRLFFFGEECQPKAAKELREKEFYAKNMPFVPPDASPALRKIITAVAGEQTSASRDAYFSALGQRAKQRAAKHKINLSKRSL